MQKTKDIKHEEYNHSLLQQAMSLKHTNNRIQTGAPEKEIN